MPIVAPPLAVGLVAAFLAGLIAGVWVNWAAYRLALNRRSISPWSPPLGDAPSRAWSDRLPVVGWLGLRRERLLHGKGFWLRPLLVELSMAAGVAALYWWEIVKQGLVAGQFESLVGPLAARGLASPDAATLATFLAHAALVALMAAASLIDVDEKTIPDGITVPGTLLGLMLATALPLSLPPHVAVRNAAPPAGVVVPLPAAAQVAGAQLYVEPTMLVAPNAWPAELDGAPNAWSLSIGLACYFVWCFALTPRIWRGRRGLGFGLRVIGARITRELARPPLAWIGLVGAGAIIVVWYRGGGAWVGLLTALVGMLGGGAMIWAVRIVGSAAMRREAMGFGDVTLMMMVGAFLGWQATVIIFFIAPFAGLIVGLLQVILRRDDVIPYGPFLCLGALMVMVRWADFWNIDPPGVQPVFQLGWLVPAVLGVGIVLLGAMLVIWRNIKEGIFGRE